MATETASQHTGIKPRLLSHGTVETNDLEAARRFYSEFLNMEVFQTSSRSIMMRLNSTTTIACVESKTENVAGIYSHFGLDFETMAEVDAAYEIAVAQKDKYAIRKITRPVDQHGTYSFYIIDFDGNWWEILTNPTNGYTYIFETPESDEVWRDQNQGRDRRTDWEQTTPDS